MTAVKSGLMIIDQYRAHTRILYEGYLDQMQKHRASSQKPLFPDTIHFSPADKVVAEAIMPELQNIGFELTRQQRATTASRQCQADSMDSTIPPCCKTS